MRPIDADALRTVRSIQRADFNRIETIQKWIDEAPTIEPVRRGRWLISGYDAECSVCREIFTGEWEDLDLIDDCNMRFCPNCGALMEEQEE